MENILLPEHLAAVGYLRWLDAGTTIKDGCRRSTRIRIRPLEHWRGERAVYGRDHRSKLKPAGGSVGFPLTWLGSPCALSVQ